MQKWEYLEISWPGGRTVSINGKRHKLSELKIDSFYDYINKLGEEGWELVALTVLSITLDYRYIFKRPKEW